MQQHKDGDLTLYAILSDEGRVIKTSKGHYYLTRSEARTARKEVEGKVRIVKGLFTNTGWETAK